MILKDKVVAIHYTLTGDDGEVVDSSQGQEPLQYLHGYGEIIVGLEKNLEGMKPGDDFKVKIAPDEGYGGYDNELVHQVPLEALQGVEDVEIGMVFTTETEHGTAQFVVTEVECDKVTLDANHPLAGKNLNFEGSVVEVRDASSEEISHGHAHGADGHHH